MHIDNLDFYNEMEFRFKLHYPELVQESKPAIVAATAACEEVIIFQIFLLVSINANVCVYMFMLKTNIFPPFSLQLSKYQTKNIKEGLLLHNFILKAILGPH